MSDISNLEDDFIDEFHGDYTKRYKASIDIPDFIKKGNEALPTEEQIVAQAILDNVPGNVDIEKQNHLAELERACQNWDKEEWAKIIIHANSHLMLAEMDRRAAEYEKSILDTRAIFEKLAQQKL